MIYLSNTTSETQRVYIPLEEPWSPPAEGEPWSLEIYDTFRCVSVPLDAAIVESDLSPFAHYVFAGLEIGEDLPAGSYEYRIKMHDGTVIAAGCCQVGGYRREVTSYNKSVEYDTYTS